jgi:hypothetical protein
LFKAGPRTKTNLIQNGNHVSLLEINQLNFAATGKNKRVNLGKEEPHPNHKPKKVYHSFFLDCIDQIFLVDKEMLTANWDESVEKFDDLSLKEEVLRGIYGYGFVKPSPIQQKGILPVIQGKDTIAQV